MKWALLSFLVLFIIIFLTNVRISLEYKREHENDVINIEGSIWFGLIRLKYRIPMLQIQSLFYGVKVNKETKTQKAMNAISGKKKRFRITPTDVQQYLQKIILLRKQVHDFNVICQMALKKFQCDRLEWKTRVGIGDAAATGVMTGLVWGVKTTILGIFGHYITLRTTPKLDVIPAFQSSTIDTYFHCILRFRIGNAIIAGTRILLNLRKGREGIWQSTLFRA